MLNLSNTKKEFPTFLDWMETKDVKLTPSQWELVRLLSDPKNKRTALSVSRNGKTVLHNWWWEYHGERAKALGIED